VDQAVVDLHEMGITVSRNQLLADCLQELHLMLTLFRAQGFPAMRADWMALDAYADKAVTLKLPDLNGVVGVAAGVDETGAFLLRDPQSGIHAYSGGEISLRLDTRAR
jgi:BirA family biotin operon repressor/biotin-[acetyl-CoA-carboxylase] ligase